ncbi:MAG: SLC13 family permease [Planctomycetota bacterium]|nr:SLC13 family permease [Planctomycetota bacterium]
MIDFLPWEGWATLGVTVLIVCALIKNWAPADAVFLGATVLLAALKIITPEQAFSGFSNPGVLTIAALFVVAAALRETGVLNYIGDHLLGHSVSEKGALGRLAILVVPLSALVNNTPIVAMMVPVIIDWCRKRHISPSRLLIPLSYLAILGGTCTLIGTSTNLIIHGLLLNEENMGLQFFEIGKIGILFTLVGTTYLMFVGPILLPKRKELLEQLGDSRREYLVELLVENNCRLIGQTIETAGLRQLPGLFLIEIDRDGSIIAPVTPDEIIHSQDRMVFTGIVSTIVDLEKIPGLRPATDQSYHLSPAQRRGRLLSEAVISPTSPLIGKSIRNANFRAMYNAAVVAVHRNGSRVTNKVGNIILNPGDTLLLQAGTHFSQAHRNNPDFYLVSDVEDSHPLRYERAGIAVMVFLALLTLMVFNVLNPMIASFIAAGVMVGTRCVSAASARKSIEWQVLITIAAAFGVGSAIQASTLGNVAAQALVAITHQWGPHATLAAVYITTVLVTEVITNNAAAVLMFPLCLQTATVLGVQERPFIIALALAASASFASPVGYQTNMMVYGPGGYRFTDFLRIGLPLNIILCVVAIVGIPYIWPFD